MQENLTMDNNNKNLTTNVQQQQQQYSNNEDIRTEVVQSAVRFLMDPNVEKSTLEKKVAFLESKGLTAAEIKLAMAQSIVKPSSTPNSFEHGFTSNLQASEPLPPQLPPYSQPPQSTWREYMMTSIIFGSVGYSIYGLAQSFLVPLLKWPSEEDLELERKKMDDQFEQAFQAIETMKRETQSLLDKVYTQNSTIEKTLVELSEAVKTLKQQDSSRLIDVDKLWSEMEAVKKLIPEAFTKSRDSQASYLSDLQTEIKSLKALVSRRSGSIPAPSADPTPAFSKAPSSLRTESLLTTEPLPIRSKSEASTPTTGSQPPVPSWQLSRRSSSKKPSQAQPDSATTTTPTATDENSKPIHLSTSPPSLQPTPQEEVL